MLPLLGVRDAIARGRAASAAVAAERRWFRFRPAGIDGVVEGYDMAVDRFDRVLAELGAHRVKTVGETFDPTTMNAVEACPPAAGADAGQVVGEHRSGFVFGDGETLRLADVVVTRAGAVAPVTADEERVRDDS